MVRNSGKFIEKYFGKTAVVVIMLVVAFAVNNTFHFFNFGWGSSVKTTIAPAAASEITRIEPITLDCRARITANVPVKGKKDYQRKAFGQTLTFRTDKMKLTAIGDVDTCVRGGSTITELKNGGWLVAVPASSIVFNRPRVNTVLTDRSVRFSKGWFGKLSDAFPWVSENNNLIPDAYAYAQTVIGGSSCMQAAWQPTQDAIRAAYQQQAVAKHLDPKQVTVVFDGTPNFNQNADILKATKVQGMTFLAEAEHVTCKLRKDALKIK